MRPSHVDLRARKMPAHWRAGISARPSRRPAAHLPAPAALSSPALRLRQFDFSEYDWLSNKSGFAHGVITPRTRCTSVCLTPTRYLWRYQQYAAQESWAGHGRSWPFSTYSDVGPARRRPWTVHCYLGEIRRRVAKYYRRDSTSSIHRWISSASSRNEHDDYYLFVGGCCRTAG